MEIKFNERGLVTVVVQDAGTREVLMVAWMTVEALRLTRSSGQAWFWSRSRQQLWRKGATSGNTMQVQNIRVDCDADSLLLLVEASGPACHTGERTCFHQSVETESDQ
jgi:phosphoribosyl-AMP cyclohydrolase